MYKLILFDLGGVLFTSGMESFMKGVAGRYNIQEEKILELVDYGEVGSAYREGKMSRDDFWKEVIATLSLKEDADTLEQEWIGGYKLIEKTKEIIQALRNKYKVFFLSDNTKEREVALDAKYGFKKMFDDGVFSHDEGVRKPNPRIYQIALERAGESAEDTIFIDDKETSLVPARKMGITAILFETPEKLEKDLRNLGVL